MVIFYSISRHKKKLPRWAAAGSAEPTALRQRVLTALTRHVTDSAYGIKLVIAAHTSYDDDNDKNPKNHIKIEVTAAISFTAFSHCRLLLSKYCNIYYEARSIFADCPRVLLVFFTYAREWSEN